MVGGCVLGGMLCVVVVVVVVVRVGGVALNDAVKWVCG